MVAALTSALPPPLPSSSALPPYMTGREVLRMYARLRGLPRRLLEVEVKVGPGARRKGYWPAFAGIAPLMPLCPRLWCPFAMHGLTSRPSMPALLPWWACRSC